MEDQNHLGTTLVAPYDSCYWWGNFLHNLLVYFWVGVGEGPMRF